jgi:hypothetical protein
MILQFSAFRFHSPGWSAYHRWRRVLVFALALLVFVPILSLPVSANVPSDPVPENEHFVIYRGQNGDMVCREATALERRKLDQIRPTDLRLINHFNESLGKSNLRTEDLPQHLTIILRATGNLDANVAAKAAFVRAAAAWESRVSSPVTVYLDVDVGATNFGATWDPDVLGATRSANPIPVGYTALRDALIAGANTPAKLALYNALPASSVPTDLGIASTVSVSASIARATGLIDPTAQSGDSAAMIAFNSASSFDFDRSNGITTGQLDFEAVAIHEIGHALGFTSRSGFNSSIPSVWDIYRFRSGITSATFTTAQRILTVGGPTTNSQSYFVPNEPELGLSDGGPAPPSKPPFPNNSDGNQSSHWREAFLNGGTFSGYIGIMDPRIPFGITRDITDADIRALNVFGYNSNLPSPPANDNFTSAQTIAGCSGSVNGTNAGATREAGEPIHSPDNKSSSRSVWYQWQAPSMSSVTIATAGSGFDTVLAVYTGASVGSLTLLGGDDDNSGTDKTSTVTFAATAGVIYKIAVDGYNNGDAGGDVGSITLNWNASNCIAGPPPQIILDQSGPAADQAAAVDSILLVRDPFFVINEANPLNLVSDPNTRVIIFVSNLSLLTGEPSSSVEVNLIDSNNQSYNIGAEDVRFVPGFNFTQVTFRLPNLPAGECRIKVVARSLVSNTATFRIRI